MRILAVIIFFISSFLSGFSHDAKEAFFTINNTDQGIEVKAEFPWSIRSALIQFSPELENAKLKAEFEDALYAYVTANLSLTDVEGNNLPLMQMIEGPKTGHSHQTDYVFVFKSGNLAQVTNTIMFGLNEKQINYHIYAESEAPLEFKTTSFHPMFTVQEPNTKHFYEWFFAFVSLITLLVLGVKLFKK